MPIKLIRQNITNIKCDAIVDPTDPLYSHGGGADAAIHRAAGEELYRACTEQGRLGVGKAVITPAFNLPCKYVIHTVGPWWHGGMTGEEALLRSCYNEILKLALQNKCKSIAIPLISSGRFGFPKDRVLRIAVDVISEFLFENEMLVYIVVFDKTAYKISEKLFSDVTSFIDKATEISPDCMPRSCFGISAFPISRMEYPRDRAIDEERFALEKESIDANRPKRDITEVHAKLAPSHKSLEDMIKEMDKGFADTLFYYIDQKGITDVECYKRANVDKKTFSKIKCNKDYRPSKITAVSFAIALHLDLKETNHLLNTAGMSLSKSSIFDVIIEYFVTTGNYKDIFDVNETLYQFDQATLGV